MRNMFTLSCKNKKALGTSPHFSLSDDLQKNYSYRKRFNLKLYITFLLVVLSPTLFHTSKANALTPRNTNLNNACIAYDSDDEVCNGMALLADGMDNEAAYSGMMKAASKPEMKQGDNKKSDFKCEYASMGKDCASKIGKDKNESSKKDHKNPVMTTKDTGRNRKDPVMTTKYTGKDSKGNSSNHKDVSKHTKDTGKHTKDAYKIPKDDSLKDLVTTDYNSDKPDNKTSVKYDVAGNKDIKHVKFDCMSKDDCQGRAHPNRTGNDPAPVPEPATFVLLGSGFLVVSLLGRRNKKD